ncbi:phthiocerol/phthiodiolone dimycocerosyl transferase family protein [Nocardia takedensis]
MEWHEGEVVRVLSPSEQRFVRHATYTGRSVRVEGDLDTAVLDQAFKALALEYPVLVCRIAEDDDGTGRLLRPSGAPVAASISDGDTAEIRIPADPVDPRTRLAYLDVTTSGADHARVTLFAHHAVADARFCVELFTRLWDHYTDRIDSAATTVVPHDYPNSLEWYAADRGIERGPRSGLEPAARALTPAEQTVPADPATPAPPSLARPRRVVLDADTTARVVAHGSRTRVSVNGLVTAALLRAYIAETAGVTTTAHCLYPVDLRTRLEPPVQPAGGTNMAGLACFSADIDPAADLGDLGSRISARLRADLASGLIAQSALHFPDYFGPHRTRSTAGHIAVTNTGRVPDFRVPTGLTLTDYEILYLSAHPRPSTGASAAVTFLVYTFGDNMTVGILGGGAVADRLAEAVADHLRALAVEPVGA